MVAGVERRKTNSKMFRVEIEAPKEIAKFLRGRVLSGGYNDEERIGRMLSAFSSKIGSGERARVLLCKYFKEAEDDQSLRYIFDDDVFSAIMKVLGEAYLKTTYTYEELGIDGGLLEELKKIDVKKFIDKRFVIKTIEELMEKLKEQMLFISVLNHPSVLMYADYATAKLRIRTAKVFLSQYDLKEVYDFLKMVDEVLGFRVSTREDSSGEKNKRVLHRIYDVLHEFILDDMSRVLGGQWTGVKEMLEEDKNTLVKLEGLKIEGVQKEIVEKTRSKNP